MKKIFSNEIVLGTMIAVLSVFTAFVSYQGAIADSKQNEFEIKGMKDLNDGNAEYLRANQDITQDYNYFDNWYINDGTDRQDIADYYQENFSEALQAAFERDNGVWDDEYYDAMYADAYTYWDSSDANFETGSQYDERGDQLQLVLLISALGLAFVAWASLLGAESNMRVFFAILGAIALAAGIIAYVALVPGIAA
ncbi:MAG TPA: hypothetical protein PK078_11700 [Anaerolineales bacterium]|nr:hypothetical protein [Anaerolineales bacterium]HNA89807.1 hypothetical protein [Anaerolineales bacterium]HNB37003.1 hypothetical protein [Anaerolineales bacterium]